MKAWIERNRLMAAGLGALAVVLAVIAVFAMVREAGRDDIRKADAAAVVAGKVKAAEARGVAADERVADAAVSAAQHEERQDAIRSSPDTRPSDRAFQRRCVQLRQQGVDPARIPGGERCASPAKAAPKR